MTKYCRRSYKLRRTGGNRGLCQLIYCQLPTFFQAFSLKRLTIFIKSPVSLLCIQFFNIHAFNHCKAIANCFPCQLPTLPRWMFILRGESPQASGLRYSHIHLCISSPHLLITPSLSLSSLSPLVSPSALPFPSSFNHSLPVQGSFENQKTRNSYTKPDKAGGPFFKDQLTRSKKYRVDHNHRTYPAYQ